MTAQLLFFYFAGMTVAGAIVAVAAPNLVYSALALLLTFIHIAGIYVLLNAEFIAAVQIIVYAGAILVLYLFVLMLFNPEQEKLYLHKQYPVGIFLGVVVLFLMILAAFKTEILGQKGSFTVEAVRSLGHTDAIGRVLYAEYIFPFEIASLILLVAMFGAILLAGRGQRPRKKGEPSDHSGGDTPSEEKPTRTDEVMVGR
ncbi:MAG: NADH-quinone oxidoreductase subunit J [Nitrospira sp.]|nr:NADH-quinone oxidoreductase subunit J [Candidatus Manganitrophaceae bacterium]HIL35361.1 NADH-quinone oxidoreductase subunit J [Candidatus Manganitrophaceae bacterium]